MRLFLILCTFIGVFTGCKPSALEPDLTQTLDAKTFTINAPAGWRYIPEQGTDSQVGRFTNGTEILAFDFGWYSYNFSQETATTYTQTPLSIDGRQAFLIRPKKAGQGIVGLYVVVDAKNRLAISSQKSQQEALLVKMLWSVKFP